MKKIVLLALFSVVALAFILRLYKIGQVPPSLNWDEVSIGYNAYSILKTGHDEWGEFLPLHFQSYGEYKLPGQVYASIPAIVLFGLTPFGVRITPVIYGTLTIVFLFFLTKEMFKKDGIALLSAFFLAVSPWHLQLTRASFEASFALMWVVLGVWFFVRGFKDSKWWLLSIVPFSLAVYTYNSARMFVPIFLFVIFIIYRKELLKYKKIVALSTLLFGVLMIPLLLFMLSGGGEARYKLVSVTDEAGLVPRIEEARNSSVLPPIVTKVIHNRPTYISYYFIKNYLAHFTPDYLFVNGASHAQHHAGKIGELYLIQMPLLIYGLYIALKRHSKYLWLLLSWVLLSVIPAALTRDSIPHALRTLNGAAVYQIFSGVGLYYLSVVLGKKTKFGKAILFLFVTLLFGVQFIYYLKNYYQEYSIKYSRDWQYGYQEVVSFINKHYDEYDLIVITREYGEPHMFTLFYLEYPPEKYYQDQGLVRFKTHDWVRVLNYDKFYFPDLGDEGTKVNNIRESNPGKKILFIGTAEEITQEVKTREEINFLNSKPAFKITDGI